MEFLFVNVLVDGSMHTNLSVVSQYNCLLYRRLIDIKDNR